MAADKFRGRWPSIAEIPCVGALLDEHAALAYAARSFLAAHKAASGRSCMCVFCQGFRAALETPVGEAR